jgi:hypothetical protein
MGDETARRVAGEDTTINPTARIVDHRDPVINLKAEG